MSPYVHNLRAGTPWPANDRAQAETDRELAPRQEVSYTCPSGHATTIPFADGAEVPGAWDCRRCGKAARRDGAPADAPADTHLPGYHGSANADRPGTGRRADTTERAQLYKRRSKKELDALLAERLAEVRQSGVAQ